MVLKLLQCTNLGGMEKSAIDSMKLLGREGMQFTIATPRPFGLGKPLLQSIDPTVADDVYRGKFGWRSQAGFTAKAKARAALCSRAWITGTDVACLRAASKIGLPTVLAHHYHHLDGRFAAIRWRLFYELACASVQAVTYPTDFTRNEAMRIAPRLKNISHVVRYHFEPAAAALEKARVKREARRELGLNEDRFIVGNAGWLIARKRWDIFVEVAIRVCALRSDAVFVICGGGPDEEALRTRVDAAGLGERIVFTGWVANVERYFAAFDVLLFNSDFDTLPRTPGEAAAQGCVVVASLLYGGLAEFIEDGVNGRLLDRHDVGMLSATILALARDVRLMREWREAAIAKLRADFSANQSIAFYRDFFHGQ